MWSLLICRNEDNGNESDTGSSEAGAQGNRWVASGPEVEELAGRRADSRGKGADSRGAHVAVQRGQGQERDRDEGSGQQQVRVGEQSPSSALIAELAGGLMC